MTLLDQIEAGLERHHEYMSQMLNRAMCAECTSEAFPCDARKALLVARTLARQISPPIGLGELDAYELAERQMRGEE